MKIISVLELSTEHLPAGDLRDDLNGFDGVIAIPDREYGWWMWVPDDVTDHNGDYPDLPNVVTKIQEFARSKGCDWVRFDRDAHDYQRVPLPTFPEKGPFTYLYIDHDDNAGEPCRFSCRPVESGVIDEMDPDAADDERTCPDDCDAGGIFRVDERP